MVKPSRCRLAEAEYDIRRTVLEAAQEVFAARGYRGARVQEIADRAGVNKALLFYYYADKKGLYREVFRRLTAELTGLVTRVVTETPDHRERVRFFVNGFTDFLAENPHFLRLLTREILDVGPHMKAMAREYFRPLMELGVRDVREGIRKGHLRKLAPVHFILSLAGMIIFPFLTSPIVTMVWGKDVRSKDMVKGHKQSVVDLLLHGAAR